MSVLRLGPVVLLSGCSFGLVANPFDSEGNLVETDADADADADGDADGDTDTDADGDAEVEVDIDSIEPSWGSAAGGTDVLITGTFLDDATVRFGGVEAEVLSVSEKKGELRVRTPEFNGDEGAVSVVVSSGNDTETEEDGFYFFADGTGMKGAVGSVIYVDIVGDYWSDSPRDYGYAFMYVTPPNDFDWGEYWSGTIDQCKSDQDYTGTAEFEVYDLGNGSGATARGGAKSFDFTWNASTGALEAADLTGAELGGGLSYDLADLEATSGAVPPMDVPDLVEIPGAFTVNAPDIDGVRVDEVSSSFALSWSGSGGDGVLVQLGMRNSSGNAYQETVFCWLRDDGSHNVSGSSWNSWPTGRQLDIYVSRYIEGSGTWPHNNASSGVIGEYTVYGAVFTR